MAVKKATKKLVRAKKAKSNPPVPGQTPQKGGRGNPPEQNQFKKGQSGNPKGRPKGSKNLATLIADAAYDKITVTTKSGEKRKLTRIQATTLQLANKAAQGEMTAMVKFMNWVDDIETRAANAKPTEISIADADLKVLEEVYKRIKQCEGPQA